MIIGCSIIFVVLFILTIVLFCVTTEKKVYISMHEEIRQELAIFVEKENKKSFSNYYFWYLQEDWYWLELHICNPNDLSPTKFYLMQKGMKKR